MTFFCQLLFWCKISNKMHVVYGQKSTMDTVLGYQTFCNFIVFDILVNPFAKGLDLGSRTIANPCSTPAFILQKIGLYKYSASAYF